MSEFDALLQIGALALGMAAGYAAYSYKAKAVIKAASSLVAVIQAIRAARADGVETDAEKIRIGEAALEFEADVGNCKVLARR